jgi:glycosyltransferase involved in cell wall biosynthesis
MQSIPKPTHHAPSLSCVMPAFNEQDTLEQVVPEVLHALLALSDRVEIVLVDDGSSDDTAAAMARLVAQHPQVVSLGLSRNFGKEAALSAGLDAAQGDVVFLMDADGQHPVSLLAPMLAHWREGAEVVYAVRNTRHDQSSLHALLTQWFYRLVNAGSRVKIPANAGDFRLLDRAVVNALKALPETNRFMKGLYAWVGYRSVALNYDPLDRIGGNTSFGLLGGLSLAVTGLVSFSVLPLRLLSLLGLMVSLFALGYGVWVIVEYFLWGIDVPGYATLVVALMFFSGVQLLALGILAEYIGRIYDEVKRRPRYVVRQREGLGLGAEERPR